MSPNEFWTLERKNSAREVSAEYAAKVELIFLVVKSESKNNLIITHACK